MATVGWLPVTGQVSIDVDEDRTRYVAGFESGPSVAAIEVPTNVGGDDAGAQCSQSVELGERDDGTRSRAG
jgi:hypothetical protein